KVGSGDHVSIVAQFDRSGRKGLTNRYVLRKGTPLDADVVTALGETNTGDPAVLRDFVTWAVTSHPAERYMLVIWNHGAGWDDSNLYGGDYFGGAAPPVVRKGVVVRPGTARGRALEPVRSGTVQAAVKRARRALFRWSPRAPSPSTTRPRTSSTTWSSSGCSRTSPGRSSGRSTSWASTPA
ncbi:MAG: hypothetical protein DMD79_27460, partial [Candidatus Rokuibacteriota bacterium]